MALKLGSLTVTHANREKCYKDTAQIFSQTILGLSQVRSHHCSPVKVAYKTLITE